MSSRRETFSVLFVIGRIVAAVAVTVLLLVALGPATDGQDSPAPSPTGVGALRAGGKPKSDPGKPEPGKPEPGKPDPAEGQAEAKAEAKRAMPMPPPPMPAERPAGMAPLPVAAPGMAGMAADGPPPAGKKLKVWQDGDKIFLDGDPAEVGRLRSIIAQLMEGAALTQPLEVQTYPLTNAKAAEVVEVLGALYQPVAGVNEAANAARRSSSESRNRYLVDPARSSGGGSAAPAAAPDANSRNARRPASFTPDRRTNSVIALASHEDQTVIAELIKQLDRVLPATRAQVKVFTVAGHTSPDDLANSIRKVLGTTRTEPDPKGGPPREFVDLPDGLVVVADAGSRSLLVSALPEQFEKIEPILKQVVVDSVAEVIPLRHANAKDVADLLNTMFTSASALDRADGLPPRQFSLAMGPGTRGASGRSSRSGRGFGPPSGGLDGPPAPPAAVAAAQAGVAPGDTAATDVKIAADTRNNAILITARRETLTVIKKIIEQIDRPAPEGESPIFGDLLMFVYEARFVDVESLAARVQTVLEQINSASGGGAGEAGGGDDLARALVVPGLGGPNAPPAAAPAEPAKPKLTYSLDTNTFTNELTILANRDTIRVVKKVIEKYDTAPKAPVGDPRVGMGGVPGGLPGSLPFGAFPRELLSESPMQVKAVFLKKRPAQEVADIVRVVYEEQRKANLEKVLAAQARPGGLKEKLPDLRPVKLSPMPNANILMVTAPSEEMATLDLLITKVDDSGTAGKFGDYKMLIVPLNNAEPERVSEVIEKVINGRSTRGGVQLPGAARPGARPGAGGASGGGRGAAGGGRGGRAAAGGAAGGNPFAAAGGPGGALGGGGAFPGGGGGLNELQRFSELDGFFEEDNTGQFKSVRVAVDARTRSLIIWTPIDQVEIIKSLIAHLDDEKQRETQIVMFQLRRATAAQVQTLLEDLLLKKDDGRGGGGARIPIGAGGGGRGGPALGGAGGGAAFDFALLQAQFGGALGGLEAEAKGQEIRMATDERTNSILVSGNPAVLKIIGDIIRKIDNADSQVTSTFKLVRLRHTKATDIAGVLQQSAPRRQAGTVLPADAPGGGGAGPAAGGGPGGARGGGARGGAAGGGGTSVTVTPYEAHNLLIIRGLPDDLEVLDRLIAALDVPESWSDKVRIYALNHIEPAELAGVLGELLRQGAALRGRGGGGGGAAPAASDDAVLLPQPATKTLIVSTGSEDVYALTELMIAKLDRPRGDQLYVVSLQKTDATQMAELLQRFAAAGGASSGAATSAPGGPLANLPGGLGGGPAGGRRGGGAARSSAGSAGVDDPWLGPLNVAVDTRTNSLVIQTKPDTYERVIGLIARLESQQAPLPAERAIELVELRHVAPDEAATALQSRWEALTRTDREGAVKPEEFGIQIEVDARAGALVLIAAKTQMTRLRTELARIDVPDADPIVVEIVKVAGQDAATLVQTLNTVLATGETSSTPTRGGAGSSAVGASPFGTGGGPFSFLFNRFGGGTGGTGSSNATTAGGGRGGAAGGGRGGTATTIRPGGTTGSSTVSSAVIGSSSTRTYRVRFPVEAGKSVEVDLRRPVTLTAEPNTNAIIIRSTTRNVASLKLVIAAFQKLSEGAAPLQLKNYKLQNAEAATVLTQVSTLLQQAADQKSGIKLVGGPAAAGLDAPVSLATDDRANSILALGTEPSLALVESLIRELDAEPSDPIEVKVFALKEADPAAVGATISEVFNSAPGTTSGAGAAAALPGGAAGGGGAGARRGGGNAGGASAQAERLLAYLKDRPGGLPPERVVGNRARAVTANTDGRTNALIVTASARNMRIVEELIQQLDKPDDEGQIWFHAIQFADAAKLATTLDGLINNTAATPNSFGRGGTGTRGGRGGAGAGGAGGISGSAMRRPVFTSDARTNVLIVQGSESVDKTVTELLAKLDVRESGVRPLHLLPVKHYANLDQLAALLQAAFEAKFRTTAALSANRSSPGAGGAGASGGGRGGSTGAAASGSSGSSDAVSDADRVSVIAEPAGRQLIVAASPDNLKVIADLLTKIDQPVADGLVSDIRIFVLLRANVASVQTVIADLFNKRSQLAGLGSSVGTSSSGGGNTASAAALLKSGGATSPGAGGGAAASSSAGGGERLILSADTRQNTLLVGAPPDAMKIIEKLVAELDRDNPKSFTYRIAQLYKAPAADVVRVVDELKRKRISDTALGISGGGDLGIQDNFSLVADDRTNSVVVYAHPDAMEGLIAILRQVDDIGVRERLVIYRLEHVSPDSVAPAVQDLLSKRNSVRSTAPATGGMAGGGMAAGGMAGGTTTTATGTGGSVVVVRADVRTRQLLISANDDDQRVVADLLRALDRPADEGRQIAVEMVLLAQARAADIAASLNSVYAGQNLGAGGGGLRLPGGAGVTGQGGTNDTVSVTADERTNAIIISASRDILPEVVNLTRKLDESVGEIATVELIRLERGDPEQIRTALLNLLKGGSSTVTTTVPGGGGLGAGARGAAPRTGTSGSAGAPIQISFTAPGTNGRGTLRVPVDPNKVFIEIEKRTNVLMVKAPPLAMPLIKDLIAQLDSAPPQENLIVEVIALENADAATTSNTLQAIFNQTTSSAATGGAFAGGTGGTGGAARPTTPTAPGATGTTDEYNNPPGRYGQFDPVLAGAGVYTEGGPVASLLYKTIRVSPDTRTNSLILVGDRLLVELGRDLARRLDSDSSLERTVFVYPLKYASADLVAQRVSNVLAAQNRGVGGTANGNQNQQINNSAGVNRVNSGGRTSTSTGGSGVPGSTADLNPTASSFGQGNAVTSPGVVASSVQGSQQANANRVGGSVQQLLETDVTVVSDPDNNAVVVSSPRRYSQRVRDLIRELDRQPPQVVIQALIAEVTVNDDDIFGASISYAGGNGTTTTDSSGATTTTNVDRNAGASQFRTVGAPNGVFSGTVFANIAESTGGLTVSGAGYNLSYFIRALQTQGRLRVLSEPKILTLNNQPAFITVGQRVPIPTGTTQGQVGGLTTTVQYTQVGIILEVIPHVNPEGLIRLELRQENSSIDNTRTQVIQQNADGTAVTASVFNTREVQTQIQVKDGETVVIGGLISDQLQERLEKVPFIGDIPLLGLAFSGRVQSNVKTELVIIITPRVIRSVEEARAMTQDQKRRYFIMDDRALNFDEFSRKRRNDHRFGDNDLGSPLPTTLPSTRPGAAPGTGPSEGPSRPFDPAGEPATPRRLSVAPADAKTEAKSAARPVAAATIIPGGDPYSVPLRSARTGRASPPPPPPMPVGGSK